MPSPRPASEHAFDGVAALYDSWFELPLGRIVDELEKDLFYRLAQPRTGERALDVGTGTGHFAADLASRSLEVVGLDLSMGMLEMAMRKKQGERWIQGDAASLPLPADSFDLVLSITALEFVADPQRAVQELWRVVRPGGRLVVAVLNSWSPWAWARRRESEQQETPFSHARFFAPRQFVQLLGALGTLQWNSSVFVGPGGTGLGWAWKLETLGQSLLRPFGALLVGRVTKCS
jgi:ubiquinone/menaquinone biosynthesis C-methylase UbiE